MENDVKQKRKRIVNGSFVWFGHNGTYAVGVYFNGWVYSAKNICQPGSGKLATDLPKFVVDELNIIKNYLM